MKLYPVKTTSLEDLTLREAATIVDTITASTPDQEITPDDYEKAVKLLGKHDAAAKEHAKKKKKEQGELSTVLTKKLSATEIAKLRDGLKTLKAVMEVEPPKKAPAPFSRGLHCDAIGQRPIREAAHLVASCLGRGNSEINADELQDAFDSIKAFKDGTATAALFEVNDAVFAVLAAAFKTGVLSEEKLLPIKSFMEDGKNGLISYGPAMIAGIEYPDVYRVALDSVPAEDKALKEMLPDIDSRFSKTGYDRIFFRGLDGGLFVAIHDGGALGNITDKFTVQLHDSGKLVDSGKVLDFTDVPNSAFEATFGFWGNLVRRFVGGVQGWVKGDYKNKIDEVAASVTPLRARAMAGEPLNWGSTLLGAGLGATALASGSTLGAAVGIMAGMAGSLTVTSWVSLLTTKKDRMAFYQAAGVNVTRPGRILV